jgi:hypothetical protein
MRFYEKTAAQTHPSKSATVIEDKWTIYLLWLRPVLMCKAIISEMAEAECLSASRDTEGIS